MMAIAGGILLAFFIFVFGSALLLGPFAVWSALDDVEKERKRKEHEVWMFLTWEEQTAWGSLSEHERSMWKYYTEEDRKRRVKNVLSS